MNLSVEHVLMFALVVCALYYLMGGCDCKEGFSEKDPNYIMDAFNTDNCDPHAWWPETFTYQCGQVVKANQDFGDANQYIYELFKKYKKLELDNHNYKTINNVDTIGTLCNCDITKYPDQRYDEDVQNCGNFSEGKQCDCLYSDEVIEEDGRRLKRGTCGVMTNPFDDYCGDVTDCLKQPPVRQNTETTVAFQTTPQILSKPE